MNSRQTEILDMLTRNKKVSVTLLAKTLEVSEVTIRKDLSTLEKGGFLSRRHGYATIVKTDDVNNRLSFNYGTKKNIAQNALNLIKDGETLMIESGSCCALLAEEIVLNRRDTTIITNSVFIASFIRNNPNARLILLGGEFQNEAQVMIGPLVKKSAENFFVDKFFMGTDGFNDVGAMSGDLMRAEAVRYMAESAKKSIILTESKKFSQSGTVPLLPFEKIDMIYTDSHISAETLKSFEDKNIKIITT